MCYDLQKENPLKFNILFMKPHLILILLLTFLTTTTLTSQIQWVQEESTWHYRFSSYWEGNGYEKLMFEKDTIIDNQACKVLKRNIVYHYEFENDTIYLEEPDKYIYQSGETIWGYKEESFIQLYDMSLSVGDTVEFMDFSTVSDNVNIVLEANTVTYNNEELKRQLIGIYEGNNLYYEIEVIEKFGVTTWPFPFFWNEFYFNVFDQRERSLRCYSDVDFELLELTNTPCEELQEVVVSIQDQKTNNIKIYPNPVNNACYIDSESEIVQLSIIDLNSNLVFENKYHAKNMELELSWLPDGLYFVELIDVMGVHVTYKLMKFDD